jgi:hypothetical protein
MKGNSVDGDSEAVQVGGQRVSENLSELNDKL